jgi:hypothetical protein
MGLGAMAVLAIAAPEAWLVLWRGALCVMAVLAPLLAIGRTARSVVGRSSEAEFSRWFQPLEADA